ncbi:carbon-nitrogen hydrolase family protein [Iodidimonas sp. SYSU 1G8]|uniref:carbon-nitrogen hydrolase family protein n=1 Tax=Iodidimonas sp. SYSU 1G8 TaxID=3133967 RepID=UPI0031FEBF36
MDSPFNVALVQTNSGNQIRPNVVTVSNLIRAAHGAGADLVMLPEVVSLMETRSALVFEQVKPQEDDEALKAFRDLAAELDIWLHTGSLPIRLSDTKIANRSFLIDPSGTVTATYDKIHMFDVDLPNGETYRESKNYQPGDRAVVADLPWGRLGLSICYDLRFPHLYRALAKAGADFLCVPAAFTKVTGEAHWHVLLRARAIESGCFVFAAAQTGTHQNGRQTYGHSLIIDPWGEVIADGGEEVGFISARIDPAKVREARGRVPSLLHDREYGAA